MVTARRHPASLRRLEGDRVSLRRFRLADEPVVWQGRRAADPVAAPGGPGPRHLLRQRLLASGQFVRGSLDLAIESDGQVVGDVQARQAMGQRLPPGVVELGIQIYEPARRGHGLGSEAIALLTGWLFASGQAERVQLSTAVDNVAMRRVLDKLGFTFEGVMRGFMPVADRRADFALYAVTRWEWRQATPAAEPRR